MVEMERHLFNPADPISILDYLQTFSCAFNNLSIHEGATIFLFAKCMMGSAKTDYVHRLERDVGDADHTYNGSDNYFGMIRCYDESVNNFSSRTQTKVRFRRQMLR